MFGLYRHPLTGVADVVVRAASSFGNWRLISRVRRGGLWGPQQRQRVGYGECRTGHH